MTCLLMVIFVFTNANLLNYKSFLILQIHNDIFSFIISYLELGEKDIWIG